MSVAAFDPLKHKRGAHGQFTDMLKSLKPGSAVELPDGHQVKAIAQRQGSGTRKVYKVTGPMVSKKSGHFPDASQAAKAALNASAQHNHPDAVGGSKHYDNFDRAMGVAEAPAPQAAAPAGSVPKAQQNAAQLRTLLSPNPDKALKQVDRDLARGHLQAFQAAALRHLLREEQRRKAAEPQPEKPKREGGKRDVHGPADKPKAGDLKPGQTIHHDEHGPMVYMGRNATNHHVARKQNEPEGAKPRIIRLKNVKIGEGGEGSVGGSTDKPSSPSRGKQDKQGKGKAGRSPSQQARFDQFAKLQGDIKKAKKGGKAKNAQTPGISPREREAVAELSRGKKVTAYDLPVGTRVKTNLGTGVVVWRKGAKAVKYDDGAFGGANINATKVK
jgi:hypothetical protein